MGDSKNISSTNCCRYLTIASLSGVNPKPCAPLCFTQGFTLVAYFIGYFILNFIHHLL
jgi:hypothetical protein